ncbi:hypothetical protein [Paenibacillus silvisoli]|nr:hypothetical protein [Paenibacillus silvisoli]
MFEFDWLNGLGLVGTLGLSLWYTATAAGEIAPTDEEAQQP